MKKALSLVNGTNLKNFSNYFYIILNFNHLQADLVCGKNNERKGHLAILLY